MLKKRGQIFGMGYEFIFAIIIIIAILGVSVYAIVYFMGLNKCTNVGLFYDDLREEVSNARRSTTYYNNYNAYMPNSGALRTGIEKVCFGSLEELIDNDLIDSRRGYDSTSNVFMVPAKNACGRLASQNITNIYIEDYFCAEVSRNGTVTIGMEYNSRTSSKVKLFSVN